MSPLTASQILDVARRTEEIYNSHGLRCCLMGSTASYLYGVERTPNDVDLVVLSVTYTQEHLKELLVGKDRNYLLVRSRNPTATYRVLWYRIPGTSQRCKVDILIPGVLNVPLVPRERIHKPAAPHDLPVMPLLAQLLLKLQGWSDHRASHRVDMRQKQRLDVRDINALLDIVCARNVQLTDADAMWIPQTMKEAAIKTVRRYVTFASPKSAEKWKLVGFPVPKEVARAAR